MQERVLQQIFKEVSIWVYEQSGIEIPEQCIKVNLYKNPHGAFSVEAKLAYRGPLRQKTNFPRIKMDLTSHEKVVLPPEKRAIFHNYSDRPNDPTLVLSYCYEEIFAEKLRALAERARPRDLYDVIHLYEERYRISDKGRFLKSLSAKCEFKKVPVPTLELIKRHPQRAILLSEWDNMLKHQLSDLRPFEYFWERLPELFIWISKDTGHSRLSPPQGKEEYKNALEYLQKLQKKE